MRLEAAGAQDLEEVADLHLEAFPGFFLSSLGKGFLMELYSGFLSHPSGIFIVARQRGRIRGFAAGTTEPAKFFRELRRQRVAAFLVKALPAVVRNPLPVCRKLLYAARYRGEVPTRVSTGALLSSIGIAKTAMGTGVASALISAFEKEVLKRGMASVYLTTDVHDNARVNAFYAKHGYEILDRFQQSGRRDMYRYRKNLTESGSQSELSS
jgi:ribosomal protein S18 acetylase RimI-like enzyme